MKTNGVPSTRAIPVTAVTAPVQNVGHVPGSESPGNQVVRYGDRTASGTAGGRSGEKLDAAAAAYAWPDRASGSRPAASADTLPMPAQPVTPCRICFSIHWLDGSAWRRRGRVACALAGVDFPEIGTRPLSR